jgi:uncharacterized heparinase superfamily protein
MNANASPFRRLHLLQDVGPLDQEILQEQATALGRLGRALERALAALRTFEDTHGLAETSDGAIAPEIRAERARLRHEAGAALWQFIIQREACGLRDSRQVMRDYRVPAEVQARMGAMPAKPSGAP